MRNAGYSDFVDMNIPWSVNVSYSLAANKNYSYFSNGIHSYFLRASPCRGSYK